MAASVLQMKEQIAKIAGTQDGAARSEMLAKLLLRIASLTRKFDVPELKPAFEMCSALEALAKKFKENSKNATESALAVAASGLELLSDLCAAGVSPDLATSPELRFLVVDDEPLARRALTGALQMAFTRPAGAENGEMALALAEEKEFDLVFMDVCMPEMDGFTACAKLHQTIHNRATPVIFVTSYSDEKFRAQAAQSGGCDYVVKPFVFIEITVKALTFALRGRLEKSKMAQSPGRNV
jgi:PleD family two-component response regulator